MSLENKTFFEACETVPPIRNKFQKGKIGSGASLSKEDFSQIPDHQSSINSDFIGFNERREAYYQASHRVSYSGALMSSKKRWADDSTTNQQLIASNGRFPHCSTTSSKVFMHSRRDFGRDMEAVFSPNQREVFFKTNAQ